MAFFDQTTSTVFGPRARVGRGIVPTVLSLLRLKKSRVDLANLDPHLLRDIGLTENEAKTEAKRSVWDVPSNWRV